MEEVSIKFNTITPIFTGDAWRVIKELKPSAIIGSLRFWFEVYCHFVGIEVKEKEELNYNEFKKELEKALKNNPNQDIDKLSFEIASKMLTLPSLIFGCTGWKSRVEIENIYLQQNSNYPYYKGKLSINSMKYKKGNKWVTPSWYFNEGFYGEFEITFKTSNEIEVKVLLPLLKYIQKYGFIGAKNNLGYGRVEIIEPNLDGFEFDFNEFGESKRITESIFEEIENFNFNKLNYKKIQKVLYELSDNNLESLIKKLILKKAKARKCFKKKYNDSETRHYLFGTTKKGERENINIPQATKIIPLISKDGENYVGNFLSIAGIRNFGVKNEQKIL